MRRQQEVFLPVPYSGSFYCVVRASGRKASRVAPPLRAGKFPTYALSLIHIEMCIRDRVSHIWYFKGSPSRLGYLLDIAPKELEKVLYFASSIITSVDKERCV